MGALRIAVVGAGQIGRLHVAALRAAVGVMPAVIADPSAAARDFAAAQGLDCVAGVDDLPGGIDGVILATPNAAHVAGGLACVARGLPVLVEKPFAVTVAEALPLLAAARAAGVALLTGHHRRHNPRIAAAKALIEAGEIGLPTVVQGQFWLKKPDSYFDVDWRRAPGAGPVLINLIHDIDLMRHLVGEVVAVQAVTSHARRGLAVEDTAALILEFANGAVGTISVSDAVPAPWSWEMASGENPVYPMAGSSCYQIGGTAGALELPGLRLWRHDGAGWHDPLVQRMIPCAAGDPLVLQAEQFGRVIRGAEAPLVSGREGVRTLAVIEAVSRAAETGMRVAVTALPE